MVAAVGVGRRPRGRVSMKRQVRVRCTVTRALCVPVQTSPSCASATLDAEAGARVVRYDRKVWTLGGPVLLRCHQELTHCQSVLNTSRTSTSGEREAQLELAAVELRSTSQKWLYSG